MNALKVEVLHSIYACMQRTAAASNLSWDDVRLFLSLCRSRSLGEAGKRVGVDGSTMSRRLASLEEALAATLFERGRDGITATAAAERLMPVAEEMEEVMARFTGAAEAFEREIAGRVRITCPADAAEVLIAPLLSELLARHARLRIEIEAGENIVDMSRRACDLALRTARPTSGDLIVTRLFAVTWTVAASPSVAAELGSLRAWSDVPWISCSERFAQTTPGRWYAEHVGDVEPVLRSDSLAMQIRAVASGLGVALVPNLSVAHYGLVSVKLSRRLRSTVESWPEDDLYLVTHRALRNVPRVRAVWDFLIDKTGQRAAAD